MLESLEKTIYKPTDDSLDFPDTVYIGGGGDALGRAALDGDRQADVAVIGGGFVGCSAALHLAEAGKSVIVLEANEIGWGSAGRNAGHVAAHATKLEPDAVLRTYGPKYGERLNEFGTQTAGFVLGLAEKYGFEVSPVHGGILTAAHAPVALAGLRKRHDYWARLSAPVELLDRRQTAEILGSNLYAGAYLDRRGIAINPLVFIRGLARAAIAAGADLFEHSPATSIRQTGDGWIVNAKNSTIRAGHVLLCTNAYSDALWPGLRQTIIAVRGYQVWTRPLDKVDRSKIMRGVSAMLETRRMPTGVRLHHDGRLQFSGIPNLGAERHPNIADRRRLVAKMFPGIKPVAIEGWWSGWVTRGISDGWRIHRLAPNLLTAIACNGRGVAMGPAMGREMAKLVCGSAEDELLIPVTKPTRLPGYSFHRFVVPIAMQMMRWKDRRDIRAYRRQLARSGDTPAFLSDAKAGN